MSRPKSPSNFLGFLFFDLSIVLKTLTFFIFAVL
jgi:hypothetical protein